LRGTQVIALFNECIIVEDANEVKYIEKFANVTTYFFHKFVDNILHTVDNDQAVLNTKIVVKLEPMLENEKELRKAGMILHSHAGKKSFIDNACNRPANSKSW
jgi:nucleosome binding factor SPN SPT16 subunit